MIFIPDRENLDTMIALDVLELRSRGFLYIFCEICGLAMDSSGQSGKFADNLETFQKASRLAGNPPDFWTNWR